MTIWGHSYRYTQNSFPSLVRVSGDMSIEAGNLLYRFTLYCVLGINISMNSVIFVDIAVFVYCNCCRFVDIVIFVGYAIFVYIAVFILYCVFSW